MKLYDSELKVMEVLWEKGEMSASQIAKILNEEIGWNRNTTYTVIKKNIEKGAIRRLEPNFLCIPLITKREVQVMETDELLNKMFAGSRLQLFSTLIGGKSLTSDEANYLRTIVNDLDDSM